MSYFLRYIQTDAQPTAMADLTEALALDSGSYELNEEGLLTHDGSPCAEIEINTPGDGLFEEELAELTEEVNDTGGRNKRRVLETLRSAKFIVAVRVLWQEREPDATLQLVDPLFDWLRLNRAGLIQADGEGYYDGAKCIFALE